MARLIKQIKQIKQQKTLTAFFVAAVMATVPPISLAAGKTYYRYYNEKGNQVIEDSIPPEFVAGGYEVIEEDGTVIRKVHRQLSEDEMKNRDSVEVQERLREEEERRLKVWDESLMLRYSDVVDIEAARERAIRDLEIRISILRGNLRGNLLAVKSEIEHEQAKAAGYERKGDARPQDILDKIDLLQLEIEDIEESVAHRRDEVVQVKAEFQRDIDRFSRLQGRVQIRSRQAVPPSEGNYPY